MGNRFIVFFYTINLVSNNEKSDCKLNLAENHVSVVDELTNFDKMLITLIEGS